MFKRLTLKSKLILSYLVILGVGGLSTSLVGSWIVSSTIMDQARSKVGHDLETARMVYNQQLEFLKKGVNLATSGKTLENFLMTRDKDSFSNYLNLVKTEIGADFVSVADRHGIALIRAISTGTVGDDVSLIPVVRAALSGEVAAATELLPPSQLEREDPLLAQKAYFRIISTPMERTLEKTEETSGMVLMAAAPIRSSEGEILGALYGGVLLNRNLDIVDRVWELTSKGERFQGVDVGTVTIFLNDLRISTNVKTETGERALGTRVSKEVAEVVLTRGEAWKDRAFVVNDWYLSRYEPILDYSGDIIGILYVGLLERAYTSIVIRIIASFFAIAGLGFVLIIGITYYIIRNLTRPITELVIATRDIAAGRFDHEIRLSSRDELGLLAGSFNLMLRSLRQMKKDLEEWARTLEEKVEERTQELIKMQNRVVQSERLASLGRLAAGVAHEINNPLGGILSLTTLSLEDLPEQHQARENLEEVVRQTERCRDIVKGLLEFSRQYRARTEPVDVNQTLRETLALLERQACFYNIKVVKDWSPEIPAVMADASQLQQVFMNIIINAVQAMEERGTLEVRTGLTRSGDRVQITISDTGQGIPPELRDRIFEPFFTTKDSAGGTGLGLSIAYGIIAGHGGTISVESKVGKGSTFTIRMPMELPGNTGLE